MDLVKEIPKNEPGINQNNIFAVLHLWNQEKEKESMDSTKWGVAICTVDGQRCVEVISDLSSHSSTAEPLSYTPNTPYDASTLKKN